VTGPAPVAGALDERLAAARGVADAVCYEGYVLYPYRASSGKNRVRWQFGVLAPPAFAARGSERGTSQCGVVIEAGAGGRLHVRLRALQVQGRTVQVSDPAAPGGWRAADGYDDGSQVWTSFDEAVAHHFDLADVGLAGAGERALEISLPAGEETEVIAGGRARLLRRRWPIAGRLKVEVSPVEGPYPLSRVTVSVANTTGWDPPPGTGREEALRRSLVAAHLLMAVDGGRFISCLEPPRFAAGAVEACTNDGLFPVLVGEPGAEAVLASPIILYDHPAIAPESPGDMFDATEIDEILALRVLTLTDEEKREARGTDPRAAAIIDRCDAMSADTITALHGTFRSVRDLGLDTPGGAADPFSDQPPWWEPRVDAAFDPWTDSVDIGGVTVANGTRVRLRPRRRSDAQDIFVAGREATVAGVFHDVGGEIYLAVAVDDPDSDLHAWHGRYLYFAPEEVDVLGHGAGAPPGPAAGGVLVAGVGNIFLGDDGFGVEVARRLDPSALPPGVKVADFGIRGVHLAYELLEGYDTLVLIDAVNRGDPPGTVTVIEHDPAGDSEGSTLAAMDAHGMDPAAVLAMAADMGAMVRRVLVVACEVASVEEGIGLSPEVAAAVAPALEAVGSLVAGLDDETATPTHKESL
jgi:hydrogenase maturation protease